MDDDAAFAELARRRLSEERDRLTRLLEGVREEDPDDEPEKSQLQELSGYDQHQADVGSELFEREKDESIAQRLETELEEIEDAFTRLDDGSYGSCEACGKPIGRDRLEAIPYARFCVDDQAKAERSVV